MSDTVLVTGASGFVGSAVARALIAKGLRVRTLLRTTSPRTNVEGLGCEIALGDMRDEQAMRTALQNARYLFHVAADYRLWARDPEEIVRNNREGTRAVMEAALAAGAADETSRHDERSAIGAYKRSKVVAERLVEQMIADRGLPAVIVNPSTPIGPRDVKPTPTGRIIVEAMAGRIPAFVDTGLNLVHVDDVAAGHLLALEHGGIGETYVLGGRDVHLRDMLLAVAEMSGRPPPKVRLPRAPLYPIAYGAELMARFNGKEPLLTVDALRMARYRMFYSSAKAKRALGYRARPFREAIVDAVAWFREAGYVT
jgi:dihydroflavonol-4-reductase